MSIYPKRKAEMLQTSGSTGKIITSLEGAERIYSRPDTKKIISMAKSAKSQKDLIALGKFMVSATGKQDSRKPEFVQE